MKKINYFYTLIIFLGSTILIHSQEFKVPLNYKMESKEDFKKYENDILKYIDYIENLPLNEDGNQRKEANTFFIKWLTGTPDVKIFIRSYIMDYCEANANFLMIFMGGWARYTIESKDDSDEVKGALAGIKSIIKVYKNGKGVKEDSNIEDLIELEEDGELEEWIKEKIQEESEN